MAGNLLAPVGEHLFHIISFIFGGFLKVRIQILNFIFKSAAPHVAGNLLAPVGDEGGRDDQQRGPGQEHTPLRIPHTCLGFRVM